MENHKHATESLVILGILVTGSCAPGRRGRTRRARVLGERVSRLPSWATKSFFARRGGGAASRFRPVGAVAPLEFHLFILLVLVYTKFVSKHFHNFSNFIICFSSFAKFPEPSPTSSNFLEPSENGPRGTRGTPGGPQGDPGTPGNSMKQWINVIWDRF